MGSFRRRNSRAFLWKISARGAGSPSRGRSGVTGKVIVGDVSAGGCLLEHRLGFRIGNTVRLRAKDLDMEARIMWSRGDLCGMRFAQSVDPWQVIRANVDGAARLEDMINEGARLRLEPTR